MTAPPALSGWAGLGNVDASTLMPQESPGRGCSGGHVSDESEIDVYLGLDVGKGEHHGIALTPAGKKVFDKPLPISEPQLRELFMKLQARRGMVLVVVDQPASIRAVPLAVAREVGLSCRPPSGAEDAADRRPLPW
jgi:hypothetical protein